jgi:hypothetical protein
MEVGIAQGKAVPPKLEEESSTERVQIVATARWMKRVDDWRRRHPDLPNRSAAIRMLVEEALDAEATTYE